MAVFADAALNEGADGITGGASHISLHSAYSATGANELTGGSPAYARQAVAWDAATGRIADNTDAEQFDVPAGSDAAWVGFWTAVSGGTFKGMTPVGSTFSEIVACLDTDVIYAPAHGLSDNDTVVLLAKPGASIPTGLTEGQVYYVVNSTTDTLEVEASIGGGAVDITASGYAMLLDIAVESFGSQGTLDIAAGDLDVVGLY